MDQGVFRSLKAQYRKNFVRKIIRSVEEKETLPKVSFLKGMQMLVAALDPVPRKAVMNCFRKSKISSESQKAAIAEDDDPFKELEQKMKHL